MSYYHALGGYCHNMENRKKVYITKPHLILLSDPISLYRLYKILKDKKIKCKSSFHTNLHNHINLKYDKDSVYMSQVRIDGVYTQAFIEWAGTSISLKINENIGDKKEILPSQETTLFNIKGELRVKDFIPLSYVEAICIPIYTYKFYRLFSHNQFHNLVTEELNDNIMEYLNTKQKEIDLIKKILKINNLQIPIVETFTDQNINDISSIVDELKSVEKTKRVEFTKMKYDSLLKN